MKLVEVRQSPLHQYRAALAQKAQEVYDKWDDGDIDTYGGGGICHFIAEEIAGYLIDQGFEATTISSDHEVHVWTAALVPGVGIFSVDIRPYVYETGGGYSWQKIPDVVFEAEDVLVEFIATEDEKDNYFGEF